MLLRVISWNIRAGGGKRAEGIAQQLKEWQPDIVALSEFRATPASLWLANELKTQGFSHQRTTSVQDTPAVNALLIASRFPIRTVKLKHAPSNKTRWLHVSVSLASTGTPNVSLAIMAMHIPNRSSGLKYPFMSSVTDVIKQWRGPAAILLGDTNSGCIGIDEESSAFNQTEDNWIKTLNKLQWQDAFRLLNNNRREFTWYSPNGRNGFRLDQAFLHPTLHGQIREFQHSWGGTPNKRRDVLSDHAAIILDLAY